MKTDSSLFSKMKKPINKKNLNKKEKNLFFFTFFTFLLILSILSIPNLKPTLAAPAINSASGSFSHGQNITISGSGFGTKNPVAPLMWDDGENKTVNNPNTVKSEGGYSEVWSPAVCGDWRTTYKNSNSFRAVEPPHSHSTQYLGGGHKDNYPHDDDCKDVLVTVAAATQKPRWYLMWYERYSADYPVLPPPGYGQFNHKSGVFQTETTAYNGQICQVWGLLPFKLSNVPEVWTNAGFCTGYCHPCGAGCGDSPVLRNMTDPRTGWQHLEVRIKNEENAFIQMGMNNTWSTNSSCAGPLWGSSPRSYSIGGFLRWYDEGGSVYHGCDNAWRYFDDVYADNTFSRIILANNSNYASATIIEPQIPSAWNDSSVTAKVNLGKLPDTGTAYLFVFDADNNANPTGYPITLGGGGTRRGDLNADGQVNIFDIQLTANVAVGTETNPDIVSRADVNNDGQRNIFDIQAVANLAAGG